MNIALTAYSRHLAWCSIEIKSKEKSRFIESLYIFQLFPSASFSTVNSTKISENFSIKKMKVEYSTKMFLFFSKIKL